MAHPKADAVARSNFKERIESYEKAGRALIYLDESGFAHDMPRRYGYAPKGQRCCGKHNWQAKGRTNVIGALCGQTLLTVCLYETYIDKPIFCSWIQEDLIPRLPFGAVVIMDNAAFHKQEAIQLALEQAGAILEYLPPYSPDLNPIEKKWAQAKAIRRAQQCSIDELFYNFLI